MKQGCNAERSLLFVGTCGKDCRNLWLCVTMHWDIKWSPRYRLLQSFSFPVGPLRQFPSELEFPVLLLAHTSTSAKLGPCKHGLSRLFFHETKCSSSWVPSYYFCGHFNLKYYEVLFKKKSCVFSFLCQIMLSPFLLVLKYRVTLMELLR